MMNALNSFYHVGWTGSQPWARSQPVLVINQLGTSPQSVRRRASRGGALAISVNRFKLITAAAVLWADGHSIGWVFSVAG